MNIETISIQDNQSNLSSKLNYNFHLLSDYINNVKSIPGERGEKGIPGVQGKKGDRGDKGSGVITCPVPYFDENGEVNEEFKKWCIENNVSDGSVVIDSNGYVVTVEKDETGNLIFTPSCDKSLGDLISDSVDDIVKNVNDSIFCYGSSNDGPVYLTKYYKKTNFNKGIILSQNYNGEDESRIPRGYISTFRYDSNYNYYNSADWYKNTKLNGILFGVNNSSELGYPYFHILYDTFLIGDQKYLSDSVFYQDNGLDISGGYRFISNDSLFAVGCGNYINYFSDNLNIPDLEEYSNSLFIKDDNGYISFGMYSTDSDKILMVSSLSNVFNFVTESSNAQGSSYYIFRNNSGSSIKFAYNSSGVSIYGETERFSTFKILSSSYGSKILIKGGDVDQNKNYDDGSVTIKGGSGNYGGAVMISGGGYEATYSSDHNYGPVVISSGADFNVYNKLITSNSTKNSVILSSQGIIKLYYLKSLSIQSGYNNDNPSTQFKMDRNDITFMSDSVTFRTDSIVNNATSITLGSYNGSTINIGGKDASKSVTLNANLTNVNFDGSSEANIIYGPELKYYKTYKGYRYIRISGYANPVFSIGDVFDSDNYISQIDITNDKLIIKRPDIKLNGEKLYRDDVLSIEKENITLNNYNNYPLIIETDSSFNDNDSVFQIKYKDSKYNVKVVRAITIQDPSAKVLYLEQIEWSHVTVTNGDLYSGLVLYPTSDINLQEYDNGGVLNSWTSSHGRYAHCSTNKGIKIIKGANKNGMFSTGENASEIQNSTYIQIKDSNGDNRWIKKNDLFTNNFYYLD